jgi:hypothetical protein
MLLDELAIDVAPVANLDHGDDPFRIRHLIQYAVVSLPNSQPGCTLEFLATPRSRVTCQCPNPSDDLTTIPHYSNRLKLFRCRSYDR